MNLPKRLNEILRHVRGDGLAAHLVRGALGTGGLGLANKALSLATAILLGRALGTEGYGYYAFALAAVTFIAVPAQLGLPQLITREVAAKHARFEWSLLNGFRRRVTQIAAVSVIVGGVVIGGAILLFDEHIAALEPKTFMIALGLLPLFVGLAMVGGMLRGLRRVVDGTWPRLLLQPGLFVLLLLFFAQGLTSQVAVALNVISCCVSFAAMVWLIGRYWPREARESAPEYRTRDWIKSLVPFTFIAGINLINQKTDILMLGVLTSASEVGIYNVAIQGAMLVSFPLTICNAVLAPNIARLHAQGDLGRMQRLMTTSTLAISLVAGGAALILILGGEWLLGGIFGQTFANGYSALAILTVGQLVNAWAGSVGLFLSMTGHEKDTLKGVAAAAIVNVALNGALIPALGISGAAIATALSLVTWNIVLGVLVYRQLGLVPGPLGKPWVRNK